MAGRPDRVMIVGHNPGFEELVEYLSGQATSTLRTTIPNTIPSFPTAALAHLEMPDQWDRLDRGKRSRSCGWSRPRDLKGRP